MTKKQIFKRKFSVPGNTNQECKHMPCNKLHNKNEYGIKLQYGHHEPCVRILTGTEIKKILPNHYGYSLPSQFVEIARDRNWGEYEYARDRNWGEYEYLVKDKLMCPYKDKLGKPKDYIVAEKMDGTIVCDCPSGKFNRDENGNTNCVHRDTAYSNPKKFEIPVESTAKDVDAINAL